MESKAGVKASETVEAGAGARERNDVEAGAGARERNDVEARAGARERNEKASVLVVDDVEANLVALSALLDDMGCEIVRASSGNDALRELLKREFAVMLLDVQMPEMDGYEVAKYARENPTTRDVPIIFLTAMHDSEEHMLRGYGTGAVDYLLKPINAHVLRAKVRVFLDLYTSRRRLASEVAAHKATLAALELANTALRHFTNAASHDLKAPLRAFRSFLEALAVETGDSLSPMASDYLARCRRAGQRMDSLLNSLLAYARLQRPVSWQQVACDELLEHVRTDLAELIQSSNATIIAASLPTLHGDPDRLYQLFVNLVGNALKYQRADALPVVRIGAEQQHKQWVFCVEDNGIGIPKEQQSRVFHAFQRLHEDGKYQGSGLGLAICQQIVEQHHGTIWLDSEPGRGTRFFFALPSRAGEA